MFRNILDMLSNIYIPKINFFDIIEIVIISVFLYYVIRSIRDTRMWVVAKGLMLLGVSYLVAYLFAFDAILTIFKGITVVLATAIIVVFHPEIRKFLESVGSKTYALPHKNKKKYVKDKISDESIEHIVNSCKTLSKAKTGALIVLEKDIPLNEYIDTGISLHADISSQLLVNTFEKNTPLHDGAVILKEDKLIAATCYLPLSENEKISKRLGTRHRAALGISEVTDALVIVVSEETGQIAIANHGQIKTRLSADALKEELTTYQQETAIITKPTVKDFFFRNYKLKLMSFALGLICWCVLMNTSNPITSKTFYDVPITIQNESVIEEIGKTFAIQTSQEVTVHVKCNRKDIDKLSKEDIVVTADFNKLSDVLSVELIADIPSVPDAEAVVQNKYMKVSLENLVETEYKINVNKIGTSDSSCYVWDVVPEIETISVKGPESLMKIVDNVTIDVDISGVTENKLFDVSPLIYDKNGSIMNSNRLEVSSEIIKGEIKTFKTKQIPININLKPEDVLSSSLIKSYSADISEVTIAANDEMLESLNNITVDVPITINESQAAAENFSKNVKIKDYLKVDGVYIVDENIATNVSIVYNDNIKRTIDMPTSSIKLTNQQSRYKYSYPDTKVTITISGTRADVLAVKPEQIDLSIDVRPYYTGTKTAPIIFKNIPNISFEKLNTTLIVAYK